MGSKRVSGSEDAADEDVGIQDQADHFFGALALTEDTASPMTSINSHFIIVSHIDLLIG